MNPFASHCARHVVCAGLLLLAAQTLTASCWTGYPQSVIGCRAPIIVLGEIVAIDTATAEGVERDTRRYFDGARIKVEKIYKNALKDVTVAEKEEITAFMHSTNQATPGIKLKPGYQVVHQCSTDIKYKVGTRGVWFLFLKDDGKFYINRHPQQRLPLEKGDKAPDTVPLGAIGETYSKKEWAKKDKSELNPKQR